MHLRLEAAGLKPQVLHESHHECYSMTKQVISLLGQVLDDNPNLLNEEGVEMLDLAMHDYIHETNDLLSVGHCLLCQKTCKGKPKLQA